MASSSSDEKCEVPDLFKGVTYYLVGEINSKVTKLLNEFGAKRDSYLSEMVSHVIADTTNDSDYSEAKELFELPIVTSDWVVLSVYCGVQLPKEAFSLEGRIFSDVIACPFSLSKEDADSLWSMLTYHGGKCQLHLDKKVTHLITAATEGDKYTKAMTLENINIVTPDWVINSISQGEKVNEKIYHPSLIVYPKPEPEAPMSPDMVEPMELQECESSELKNNNSNIANNVHGIISGEDERTEQPRPETPTAKEALARKITSKMYGKSPSESPTPERTTPTFPSGSPVPGGAKSPGASRSPGQARSPGMASNMRISSPVSAMALQPRMDSNNIRNTLRNITNRPPTPMMHHRALVPSPSAKMPPMVGIGMQQQVRPPPPDYPFPPRGPPPLPQQTSLPHAPPTSQGGSMYYGHDPKENVPSNFCLLGCVFCIVDYYNLLGTEEMAAWKSVIEQYGGQVELSYCTRVTHVLCANQSSDVFKMAVKEGKRVVSAFWLNDCLMQKKMVPPWQALHLPLAFNSEKPGRNQMISVTNFDGDERMRLKQMINAIGAKYTGYMTHHNSALICKKPGGMKFEKAKEWRIAVVNVQWLSDLVLGFMDALKLPVDVRYLQVGQGKEFHMDLTRVKHLMGGWKTPVRITKDAWKKFSPAIFNSAGQENSIIKGPSPSKRQKVDIVSPPVAGENGLPKVLFTLYPKSMVLQLENIVKRLGGCVVSNPRHCTHLVCPSLARTMKFFVAINCCKFIVTKEWIEESATQSRFLDESRYLLNDERAETSFGCNLAESLQRAKSKPLFQDLTFYITPSTVPPVCELTSIIESAGGVVVKKRSSSKDIASLITEQGPKFVVISCINDLHLVQDLHKRKIPVFNAEFVLTGVIRQEVDFSMFTIASQL